MNYNLIETKNKMVMIIILFVQNGINIIIYTYQRRFASQKLLTQQETLILIYYNTNNFILNYITNKTKKIGL